METITEIVKNIFQLHFLKTVEFDVFFSRRSAFELRAGLMNNYKWAEGWPFFPVPVIPANHDVVSYLK